MTSGKNSSWQRTSAKISLIYLKDIMFKLEHYFYWTIWMEKIQPSGDRVWWTFYLYNYEPRLKELWTKRGRKICQANQTSKQWIWAIFSKSWRLLNSTTWAARNDFLWPVIVKYMEKNLNITNSRYSEQILSVRGKKKIAWFLWLF